VVNDRPAPETPVLGPIDLAPGQSTNFSGSYIAPFDCCGPCVDTLTARGKSICDGSNVIVTASAACPRITTPAIRVTRDCPPGPPIMGDLVFITGIVSNAGNGTLTQVVVTDDHAGELVSNLSLAPGEAVWLFGTYFTTNCGPAVPEGISATGRDVCTSVLVSNRYDTTCIVLCPTNAPAPVVLQSPRVEGGNFIFTIQSQTGASYVVEFTPTLGPGNWQSLSPIPGTGGPITVSHSATNATGFYRVKVQ
jgi:hypothetical protein